MTGVPTTTPTTTPMPDAVVWIVRKAMDELARTIDMNEASIRKEERRTDKGFPDRQAMIDFLAKENANAERMMILINKAFDTYLSEHV